jgi:SMODS and SLOG-associating 2TM effector domain 1
VALSSLGWRVWRKPEEDWYEGRAGAESARTLAWKYAIGADSFPVGGGEEDEKKLAMLFLDRLRNVVSYLEDTKLVVKFWFIDEDLLGVCAAVASSAIAWNQLNQYRNQATAYAVAARELNVIHDQIEHVPDDEWAAFAEEAEDAISREHTLWAARRGYSKPPS